MKIETGSFDTVHPAAAIDVPITTDLTSAPAGSWALILLSAKAQTGANDVMAPEPQEVIGFVANGGGAVAEYAVCSATTNGVGTSSTRRRMAAKCLTCVSGAGTTQYEAAFTSFPDATHMRITMTANIGWQAKVCYMLISGLTGAKVVTGTVHPTVGSFVDIAGVGFTSKLVLLAHFGDGTAVGSTAVHADTGLGAFTAADQWALGMFAGNNLAPPNNVSWQRTDACLLACNNGVRVSRTSIGPDGFRLTTDANPFSTGTRFAALCLDGIEAKLGAVGKATGAAPAAQVVASGHNFSPKGLLLAAYGGVANTVAIDQMSRGIGLTDLTNERSIVVQDRDAAGTTVSNAGWSIDKALLVNEGFTIANVAEADLTAADLTSFSLNWTVNDSSARQILYAVLGVPVAGGPQMIIGG